MRWTWMAGAVDQLADFGGDRGLQEVGLVDGRVEFFALGLALEAADPDVDRVVRFAPKAAGDHHALADLEGYDLAFHAGSAIRPSCPA